MTKSIGVAALAERDHLVEDAAVRVAEEIARVDQLGGVVERLVVDQDRAEHGLLGLEIVRKRAFGCSEARPSGLSEEKRKGAPKRAQSLTEKSRFA